MRVFYWEKQLQEIPLTGGSANSHQEFSVQLGARFLSCKLHYLTLSGQWSLDLYENETPLAVGLMLESNANLLEAYDLDIGSLYFVGDEATLDNIGIDNSLVWIDD